MRLHMYLCSLVGKHLVNLACSRSTAAACQSVEQPVDEMHQKWAKLQVVVMSPDSMSLRTKSILFALVSSVTIAIEILTIDIAAPVQTGSDLHLLVKDFQSTCKGPRHST